MLTTPHNLLMQHPFNSSPSSKLHIIADEKILLAKEAFSSLGSIKTMSGSDIYKFDVTLADVLVTRTTTKVNEQLLQGSKIKYVATATAGTDHIDLDYLAANNIGFTSAPGCNSEAVAEFVINALVRLSHDKSIDISGKTLGIIGVGNAGSALRKKAKCIGLKCILNDPPLFEKNGDRNLIELSELVKKSDILSLHVPLTTTGPYPTYHLISQVIFKQIKPGSILINTSRGGVINESDLVRYHSKFSGVILDVWENEPDIDFNSLPLADIATPHIAGYSLDAKIKATEIVYNNICSYFGLNSSWVSPHIQKNKPREILIKNDSCSLYDILKRTYEIYEDDNRLRKITAKSDPKKYFKALRSNYSFRREFSNFKILNLSPIPQNILSTIQCLRFNL